MEGINKFYRGAAKEGVYDGEIKYDEIKCAVQETLACWLDIKPQYAKHADVDDVIQLMIYTAISKE